MARPASGDARDRIIHIRVTDDEETEMKRRCPAGVPLSTWARETLLAQKVR